MKKIILILSFLIFNQTFCQNENDESLDKVYVKVFGKCFKDLKPLEETKDFLPLKKISFCSLYQCVTRIQYSEIDKNMQEAILKRTIEITTRLYNDKTPIYLISGMNSYGTALEENQNLTDDNNLIYISVADCLSSKALEKIKNIVNQQTLKLINKSKSKD
ncbi:MAG: hypothetical protein ABI793_03435 [Flavobacterium sp.]